MIWSIVILAAGLALLIGGADVLVRGVSGLARAMGASPLLLGLTVVAFGTSTPELVINTMSASRGQTDLAFGNIVGSCTLNICVVLAVTALIKPLRVQVSLITREIPMMILGVAAMALLSLDHEIDSSVRTVDAIGRSDGIMLLLLFCVFLYYTVLQTLQKRTGDAFIGDATDSMSMRAVHKPAWDVTLLIAGIACVAIGGRLTVSAAVTIAEAMGVPQVLIGLTLLSFGTTLPELATSILAARRGQGDLAIGNVVGSNIFNILCIGGTMALIRPIPLPVGGRIDLLFMAAISVVLLPLAIRGPRMITRAEGGLLLATYLSYTTYRALTAS